MGGHLCKPAKDSWDVSGQTPASNKRHSEDFCLEYVELVPTGLLAFDDTFSAIETVLNHLIELNNDVNDCVGDVKSAFAACVGHLQLDIATGVPDVDWVLLDIHLGGGLQPHRSLGGGGGSGRPAPRPNPIDLQAQRDKDPRLQQADAALQRAHAEMHAAVVAYLRQQQQQKQQALSRRSTGAGAAGPGPGSQSGAAPPVPHQQQHLASTTALGVSSASGAPARQPPSPASRGPQPPTPPAAGPAPGHVHLQASAAASRGFAGAARRLRQRRSRQARRNKLVASGWLGGGPPIDATRRRLPATRAVSVPAQVSADGQQIEAQPDLPEVQRFNDALALFRKCLGVHKYQASGLLRWLCSSSFTFMRPVGAPCGLREHPATCGSAPQPAWGQRPGLEQQASSRAGAAATQGARAPWHGGAQEGWQWCHSRCHWRCPWWPQVKLFVKSARTPGAPTIRARVLKPNKTDELQVCGLAGLPLLRRGQEGGREWTRPLAASLAAGQRAGWK